MQAWFIYGICIHNGKMRTNGTQYLNFILFLFIFWVALKTLSQYCSSLLQVTPTTISNFVYCKHPTEVVSDRLSNHHRGVEEFVYLTGVHFFTKNNNNNINNNSSLTSFKIQIALKVINSKFHLIS